MMTYNEMVLQSNEISAYYNIAAAGLLWSMLAGILVLPGTFTSLQETDNFLGSMVQHIPLLPISAIFFCTGVVGLSLLWYKFQKNFIWLLQHIFLYV